jgi:hypothetical protein
MEGYRSKGSNFSGYPGHIMWMKLRYGFGNQSHEEKIEILHSWYSDLRAYLPVIYEKKMGEYTDIKRWGKFTIQELMSDVNKKLDKAEAAYNPTFERLTTKTQEEKDFSIALRGIKETLDEITAITKIIDKARLDDGDTDLTAG